MTTLEQAITTIVTQAQNLAGTSTAEELIHLAKSLQAVGDATVVSDTAAQAVVDRATALGPSSSPEELIYLAKAVDALAIESTLGDVTSEGTTQINRVISEGNVQTARVVVEGDTQVTRVAAEMDTALSTKRDITNTTFPEIQLRDTDAAGNLNVRFQDETGESRGLLYWDRLSEEIRVRLYNLDGTTASELRLRPDGQTSVGDNLLWNAGNVATQVEAEAGIDNSKGVTSLRVKQAIEYARLIDKHLVATDEFDLAQANHFSVTLAAAATFAVANTVASGLVSSFILEITDGGAHAITWWTGLQWKSGTLPELTVAGKDVLGFYSYDNGTTWTGLVLGQDVK